MTTVSAIVRFDPQPIDEPLQVLHGSVYLDIRHSASLIINPHDQSAFELARLSKFYDTHFVLTSVIALFEAFIIYVQKTCEDGRSISFRPAFPIDKVWLIRRMPFSNLEERAAQCLTTTLQARCLAAVVF